MANAISNSDDVIDSRDVIARIEELEGIVESEQEALAESQKCDECDGKGFLDSDEQIVCIECKGNGAPASSDDDMATCGTCGLTWNDVIPSSLTPAPSGRCPFEYIHEEMEELAALKALAEEAEGYSSDWTYGVTLIRDSYFETYARDYANDVGAINNEIGWPANCIDWKEAAAQLQMDFTSVSFDGVDYWVR